MYRELPVVKIFTLGYKNLKNGKIFLDNIIPIIQIPANDFCEAFNCLQVVVMHSDEFHTSSFTGQISKRVLLPKSRPYWFKKSANDWAKLYNADVQWVVSEGASEFTGEVEFFIGKVEIVF